jgi:hypothetical protein
MPRWYRFLLSHRSACRGDKRITTFRTPVRSYSSSWYVCACGCYNGPEHRNCLAQQRTSARWLRSHHLRTTLKRCQSRLSHLLQVKTFKSGQLKSLPTYLASSIGRSVLPSRQVEYNESQMKIELRTPQSGGMHAHFGKPKTNIRRQRDH